MKIERKTFSAGEFKATDNAQGIAEMIVSVFGNIDGGNEIVCPGFFADSIAQRRTSDGRPKAKGVWGHDWTTPIAKTLDARELYAGDPMLPPHLQALGGLWVKAQFNLDTQRGREAFSDLQFGTIDEFSIGYGVTTDDWKSQPGIRKLIKGEWYEWSPVLVGMNSATVLLGTKAETNEPETDSDGNTEPESTEHKGQPYADHLETVLAAVAELVERSKSLADLRRKEGRAISQSRLDRMASVRDAMREMADEMDAMMTESMPPTKTAIDSAYLERRLRASAIMLATLN